VDSGWAPSWLRALPVQLHLLNFEGYSRADGDIGEAGEFAIGPTCLGLQTSGNGGSFD
jgi:hypothetical protein